MKPAPISTQVIQRDRYAEFLATLAIIASSMEKIALEVRHLQRTEVREAQEPFSAGQKGSSAMPHKRNPVTSEQICGLARVVRANAQAAFENIALWHERDISHSSVERVILPDSCILTDYLISKTEWLIDGLAVYPKRMRANLESLRRRDRERATAAGIDEQGRVARGRLCDRAAACDARVGRRRELPRSGDERQASHRQLSREELDELFDVRQATSQRR